MQPDIDSLFAAIVLPKITPRLCLILIYCKNFSLAVINVYYISHHVNILEQVEKSDLSLATVIESANSQVILFLTLASF